MSERPRCVRSRPKSLASAGSRRSQRVRSRRRPKPALATIGDLLEPLLQDALPELPEPQARALRVALLLEDGPAPADARALGVATNGVLRLVASRSPLLVVVDDVQWLDASSAAVIRFAARRLGSDPVVFLFSRREGHLDDIVPSLEHVQRVSVPSCSSGALHRLVRDRLGLSRHAADAPPPARAVRREPVLCPRARRCPPARHDPARARRVPSADARGPRRRANRRAPAGDARGAGRGSRAQPSDARARRIARRARPGGCGERDHDRRRRADVHAPAARVGRLCRAGRGQSA